MSKKQLSVRFYGEPVGILEQNQNGKLEFNYNELAMQPISIGMPLQEEPYNNDRCEAFFGGLLPENPNTRKKIANRFGISPNNSFSLLKYIGRECAGAISLHAIDEKVIPMEVFPLQGKVLSDNELHNHIKDLPKNPLFIDEKIRLSLAGVQDKAAVCVIEDKIALPAHDSPTTHILKPAVEGTEGIIENEYFCLKLAEHMGLPIPKLEIRQIKDISFLLIERYDRILEDGSVRCFHQEDFCQALGIVSINKYQNDGGPSFKACFDLLNKTTQPISGRNLLATALIFNFLIGNMDAHGKNFSLLHRKPNYVGLSPFYDLLCTLVYEELSEKMAMKIGGKYDPNRVSARHWERLCEEINYSYSALKRILGLNAQLILKAADKERANLLMMGREVPIVDKIIAMIEKRIEQVATSI